MTEQISASLKDILKYCEEHEAVQKAILNYLDGTNNEQNPDADSQNLANFVSELNKNNILHDEQEIDELLRMISHIGSNYHRFPDFFPKIFNLLNVIKEDISKFYTNEEIFSIFLNIEPIAIFLRDNNLLNFDDDVNYIIKNPDNQGICQYFNPENKTNEVEYQQAGENHNILCKLIRLDQTEDFANFIEENHINLDSIIPPSPFETNSYLKSHKDTNLIQYAVFCGSINVFRYIAEKDLDLLNETVWEYAIHGDGPEIIDFLKEISIPPPKDNFSKCLKLSVINYQKEITDILRNELITTTNETNSEENEPNPPKKHYLDPLLKTAVYSHNITQIKELIEKVPENGINELFQVACKTGFHKIVKALVNLPVIKINDCISKSVLHKACINGDIVTVKQLIAVPSTNINLQSMKELKDGVHYFDGLTPLEYAIQYGHNKIVELLLQQDQIDVNQNSRWRGNFPLNIAAIYGNVKAMDLLLKHPQIDVNVRSNDIYQIKKDLNLSDGRQSPLHNACINNHIEIVRMLLNHPGINPNIQNWQDKKPSECTTNQEIKELFNHD
ncbi:hypothetical protein M9Y10_025516 [Tritrichomonas musculus]|uniref:DUF3447 domain-containing protein n=1 Tax=Tritrichomonas musculus TaxID=1915356 RepID=A0ABR2H9Q8_9EUKA